MRFHTSMGTNPHPPKGIFSIQGPQDESQIPKEIVDLCARRPDIEMVVLHHKDLNDGGTTPQIKVYQPIRS